jgi:hypothetical protein
MVSYENMRDDEDYIEASDLRYLLSQIIHIFGYNQEFLRITRSTLLKLIREFAQQELKRPPFDPQRD